MAKCDVFLSSLEIFFDNESCRAAPLKSLMEKRSEMWDLISQLLFVANRPVGGFTYDKLPHFSSTLAEQRQSHTAAAAAAALVHQGHRRLAPDRTQIIPVTTWAHMSAQMIVMSRPLNFLISAALLT